MSSNDIYATLPAHHRGHLGAIHAFMDESPREFPLQSCTLRSKIQGLFCSHVVSQVFRNPYDEVLDVTYVFPLPPNAIVSDMVFKVDKVEITATCKELAAAKAEFEAAKAKGHASSLFTQQRGDIYTINVANIPAGQNIEITLLLNEVLSVTDGQLQYRFPTTLAPRFAPGEAIGHDGPGTTPDTTQVPDASFISPPVVLENGATFQAEVHITTPVNSVRSALHATQVTFDNGILVSLNHKAKLDSDFILSFTVPVDQLKTNAWTDGDYTCVFLSPTSEEPSETIPREAVFIVDISGSMKGNKMNAAKLALNTAIRSLMPQDRFRLIAFDDQVETFKEDFSEVTDDALNAAERWIDGLMPRGGTHMLPALIKGFEHNLSEGFQRTILFITDGQAMNENELIAAIHHRRNGARFFTLGIDTAVNEDLLSKMAIAGKGTCEVCTPEDDIEERVALIESRMGNPQLSHIQTDSEGTGFTIPPLFPGCPISFAVKGTPTKISAQRGQTGWSQPISVQQTDAKLGVFWAKERINYLQQRIALNPHEEEGIRPAVLKLGLEFNIVTKYTALVAVDPRTQDRQSAISINQATVVPKGWNQSLGVSPFFGGPQPSAVPPTAGAVPPPQPPRGQQIMTAANNANPLKAKSRTAKFKPKEESFFKKIANYAHSIFDSEDAEQSVVKDTAKGNENAQSPLNNKPSIAELIKLQQANGSIGNDLSESVLTLLVFILEGNTRKSGLRKRNVLKLVMWLALQPDTELKKHAMDTLEAAERGDRIEKNMAWNSIAPHSLAHRFLS